MLREDIADSYFKNSGYTKLESKCGSNCFDGVYTKNGEIYIVEVKPLSRNAINLSSNKNSPNDIGVQMSDKWIKSRVLALSDTGNIEAIKTAKLIDKVGPQAVVDMAKELGINVDFIHNNKFFAVADSMESLEEIIAISMGEV